MAHPGIPGKAARSLKIRPDEFSMGSPRPDEFSMGSPRPDEFSRPRLSCLFPFLFFRVLSPQSLPVALELRRLGVGHRWRITVDAEATGLQGPWSAPELKPRVSSSSSFPLRPSSLRRTQLLRRRCRRGRQRSQYEAFPYSLFQPRTHLVQTRSRSERRSDDRTDLGSERAQ